MTSVTPFNDQSASGGFISAVTPDTIVAPAASHVRTIGKLLITNVDTANAVTLSIYHVPNGGAISGDDFIIYKQVSIAASNGSGGVEDIREVSGLILEAGDTLRVLAGTASKLKYNVSGVDNG